MVLHQEAQSDAGVEEVVKHLLQFAQTTIFQCIALIILEVAHGLHHGDWNAGASQHQTLK